MLQFGIPFGSLGVGVVLASWMLGGPSVAFLAAVFMLLFAASSIGGVALALLVKKIVSISSLRYGTLLASWSVLCVLWVVVVFLLLIVIEAPTLFFVTTAVTACLMLVVGPPTLRRRKYPGR